MPKRKNAIKAELLISNFKKVIFEHFCTNLTLLFKMLTTTAISKLTNKRGTGLRKI